MIRMGIMGIQLLPPNMLSNIIIITDGICGIYNMQALQALLTQLRYFSISCSIIKVFYYGNTIMNYLLIVETMWSHTWSLGSTSTRVSGERRDGHFSIHCLCIKWFLLTYLLIKNFFNHVLIRNILDG